MDKTDIYFAIACAIGAGLGGYIREKELVEAVFLAILIFIVAILLMVIFSEIENI